MSTTRMKKILALAAFVAAPAFAQTSLLNVSYDVAREFYKDYNAAFVAHYKKTTGKDVKVDQSHAGSSAQARAVADGLEADVVTMNTTTDIDFLADKGVVAKDWAKKFPDNAAPTTSTMLMLVRNGNPKGIKDWDDLIKPGVQVVVVNPKTGGNGRYAYLAAWGYVKKKGGSDAQAAEFVGKLFKNVPILARGGRDATTAFLQRNIGDVLITFESEVVSIDREFGAGKVDAVYPSISILAENPVAVVERTVGQEGHRRTGQGLPRLPVLGRRPGDRRQACAAPALASRAEEARGHLQAGAAVHRAGTVRQPGRSAEGALQRRRPVRQALHARRKVSNERFGFTGAANRSAGFAWWRWSRCRWRQEPQARAARLRPDARLHDLLPQPDRADPAVGAVLQDLHADAGSSSGRPSPRRA